MAALITADTGTNRRPKLSERVVATIRARIAQGDFQPGEKLPTESQLTDMFGVSRTVIREAVTRLAADGLLTPRQGAGVFVNEPVAARPASVLDDINAKVFTALNVIEVRMPIEAEAAALAAQRRTAGQEAEIFAAFDAFAERLQQNQPTTDEDFRFHRAIATATNNPFYVEILDVLGRRTIPRQIVTSDPSDYLNSHEYLIRTHEEHRAIMTAITSGDSAAARDAMRRHLAESRSRYQNLLRHGALQDS